MKPKKNSLFIFIIIFFLQFKLIYQFQIACYNLHYFDPEKRKEHVFIFWNLKFIKLECQKKEVKKKRK